MATNDIKNLKSKLQSSVDKAAETKKAAEAAKAEKLREEQRLLEEKRRREEEKRLEEERLREQARLLEEARLREEAKRLEEERLLEEARKKEEEKRKFEERLREKERAAAEKKRIKAEKKKARRQANRAAKAAALAEAEEKKRQEEAAQQAEAENISEVEISETEAEKAVCDASPAAEPEEIPVSDSEETEAEAETELESEAEWEAEDYESVSPEEFERSIEELAREIKKEKKSSGISKRDNIIQLSLIAVFAIIFIGCAVWLAKDIHGKIKGDALYNQTSDSFNAFIPGSSSNKNTNLYSTMTFPTPDSSMQTLYDRLSSGSTDFSEGTSEYSEHLMNIRASITSLREVNPDVYGWIYIDGTRINYPVLRGEDNEYYLDRFYTKEYLAIGSIFADCTTKDLLTDNYNTVLYGHNISTGAMFHDVTTFLQKDIFDTRLIYIYTMDGIYVFKPFSIYETTSDVYYFKTNFASGSELVEFAQNAAAKSNFDAGLTFDGDEKLLTLSTCTGSTASVERYALHAVLVEIIN